MLSHNRFKPVSLPPEPELGNNPARLGFTLGRLHSKHSLRGDGQRERALAALCAALPPRPGRDGWRVCGEAADGFLEA